MAGRVPPGAMTQEQWSRGEFADKLRQADRVVVLFYADWCPFSRIFLPDFRAAEPEASVPMVTANLRSMRDERWKAHEVKVTPTLAYFEHGEQLERMDGLSGRGLSKRDLQEFLDTVESLQEEPRLPRRMHGPRRA